jgi:hypothetical protein
MEQHRNAHAAPTIGHEDVRLLAPAEKSAAGHGSTPFPPW